MDSVVTGTLKKYSLLYLKNILSLPKIGQAHSFSLAAFFVNTSTLSINQHDWSVRFVDEKRFVILFFTFLRGLIGFRQSPVSELLVLTS